MLRCLILLSIQLVAIGYRSHYRSSALAGRLHFKSRPLLDAPTWIQQFNEDIVAQPSIELVNFGSNKDARGVKASTQLDGSRPLVVVPADLALEVTNNRPPTPFPDFASQAIWEKSLWYQRLAFRLLFEKKLGNRQDSFKHWFAQLPAAFSTPFHWDDEQRTQLQYTSLESSIVKQREDWRTFYDSWTKESTKAKDTTFDELVWAMECVHSRAFSGVFEGSTAQDRRALLSFTGVLTLLWPLLHLGTYEQSLGAAFVVGFSIVAKDIVFSKMANLKRYVFCPVIDMFNHKSSAISDVSYNYFSNQFELKTEAVAAGEQVFINYGKQSNDRFLQFYGFVECDNPNDIYDFGFNALNIIVNSADSITSNNPLPKMPSPQDRLQIIASALRNTAVDNSKYSGERSRTSQSTGDAVLMKYFRSPPTFSNNVDNAASSARSITSHFDDITVRTLRALYCSEEEFKACFSVKDPSMDQIGIPLSSQTEKAVEVALRRIVELELEAKPTTLEEDMELLNPSDAFSGSKGFDTSKTAEKKNKRKETLPSLSPKKELALLFRIEKKKLLLEALQR